MITNLFTRVLIRQTKEFIKIRFLHSTLPQKINVGDTLPAIQLDDSTSFKKINIYDMCKNKKAVIFGVLGAFTPGCSKIQVPGYLEKYDELKSKGVDNIICISVNDQYVMNEWGKQLKTEGKIEMLADADASFTKALNLDIILYPLGSIRTKRYSMLVEDCVIKKLSVEPDGYGMTCSLAENLEI